MKKTSVYLDVEHIRQLSELAAAQGRSQAHVLREAVAEYARAANAQVIRAHRSLDPVSSEGPPPDRDFLCAAVADGPGGSIADIPEEALLKGFGE